MKLRCKVGDLVAFVGGHDSSHCPWTREAIALMCGRMTTIVSWDASEAQWRVDPPIVVTFRPNDMVEIESTLSAASDDSWQPIRDQPGEDEILRIAGHPLSEPCLTD